MDSKQALSTSEAAPLVLYLPVDCQGTKVLKLHEQRGQAGSALVPQDKKFVCTTQTGGLGTEEQVHMHCSARQGTTQLRPTCVYECHPAVACAEVLDAGVVHMQLRPACPIIGVLNTSSATLIEVLGPSRELLQWYPAGKLDPHSQLGAQC